MLGSSWQPIMSEVPTAEPLHAVGKTSILEDRYVITSETFRRDVHARE